jgi:phosphoribosylamine--glycine ligase
MKSDLVALCLAALDGRLGEMQIDFLDDTALTVVIAAGGYPGSYATGRVIHGLEDIDGGKVFHAGTRLEGNLEGNEVKTSGGRVLGVTALGKTVAEAQSAAYKIVESITFEDMMFRSDIGYRAVAREKDNQL